MGKIKLLEDNSGPAPPSRHGGFFGTLGVDHVPVNLAAAGVDVDLGGAKPSLALPEVTTGPEKEHNGKSEIALKEPLGIIESTIRTAFRRCNCNEEL